MKNTVILFALSVGLGLLAAQDVAKGYTVGYYCSSPATGVCTAGSTCVDSYGATCHLNGMGAWSVCVSSPWFCFDSSDPCRGNYVDFRGQPRGSCSCSGMAFSASGC